eukprot:IDg16849t1
MRLFSKCTVSQCARFSGVRSSRDGSLHQMIWACAFCTEAKTVGKNSPQELYSL